MGNVASKLKSIGLKVLKAISFIGKEAVDIKKLLPEVSLLLPQNKFVVDAEGKIDLAFSHVIDVVHQVEATAASAGGLTGPQKLQLATNQISLLLSAAGIANPKAFASAEALQIAVQRIVNAVVAFENDQQAASE